MVAGSFVICLWASQRGPFKVDPKVLKTKSCPAILNCPLHICSVKLHPIATSKIHKLVHRIKIYKSPIQQLFPCAKSLRARCRSVQTNYFFVSDHRLSLYMHLLTGFVHAFSSAKHLHFVFHAASRTTPTSHHGHAGCLPIAEFHIPACPVSASTPSTMRSFSLAGDN